MPATTTRLELLDKGSDQRFRTLLHDIHHLSSLLAAARSYLAALIGLTPPQYNIVMAMAQTDMSEGINVGDLAQKLRVSGAFITTELNKLVGLGMVDKFPNPNDGRGVILRLTPRGKRDLRKIAGQITSFNDQFFQSLEAEGFDSLCMNVAVLIHDGETTLRRVSLQPATLRLINNHR